MVVIWYLPELLSPVFVVFLYRSRGQRVCLNHAGNISQFVLNPFHCVMVVVGFKPDAVVPFTEDIRDIPYVYVRVGFLWQIFQMS